MFEQMTRNSPALAPQRTDDASEVDRIPVNDRTYNEIEAGGAKGPAVEGTVTDLAALVKEDGALQLVRRFSLVETAEAAPPQLGSQYHSIMKRVRSRRPTSRRARASSLGFLDAESFFRIVEGATTRSFIDAAIRSKVVLIVADEIDVDPWAEMSL
jgi:hypothetical protein